MSRDPILIHGAPAALPDLFHVIPASISAVSARWLNSAPTSSSPTARMRSAWTVIPSTSPVARCCM